METSVERDQFGLINCRFEPLEDAAPGTEDVNATPLLMERGLALRDRIVAARSTHLGAWSSVRPTDAAELSFCLCRAIRRPRGAHESLFASTNAVRRLADVIDLLEGNTQLWLGSGESSFKAGFVVLAFLVLYLAPAYGLANRTDDDR